MPQVQPSFGASLWCHAGDRSQLLCMTERLPSLWSLLRQKNLSINEVVHRYPLISLPLLDAILVRLYVIYEAAEDQGRIDRLVIALFDNVTA